MQTLQSRMKYLRNTELLSAVALPAALCFYWSGAGAPVAWGLRVATLALVSHILLQGALYWHLKLQTVVRRHAMPAWFASLYRCFRSTNIVLIAVAGMALGLTPGATAVDMAWCAGLLAFAVLEQINYYHYQLMYDTRAALAQLRRHGRLRRAALGLDLERRSAA